VLGPRRAGARAKSPGEAGASAAPDAGDWHLLGRLVSGVGRRGGLKSGSPVTYPFPPGFSGLLLPLRTLAFVPWRH
jgi:hypothetical protein